jgi:hypothetical protein
MDCGVGDNRRATVGGTSKAAANSSQKRSSTARRSRASIVEEGVPDLVRESESKSPVLDFYRPPAISSGARTRWIDEDSKASILLGHQQSLVSALRCLKTGTTIFEAASLTN